MSLNESAAITRFTESQVARLATVGSNNEAHIVPVTFALSGGSLVTMVDHKPKKSMSLKRLENIQANSHVSLLVDHYEDDWTQLWWVRIDGRAEIHHTGPQWDEARRLLVLKYPAYRERAPEGAAIVTEVEKFTWWEWPL